METQLDIAISILSALLTGGFILFFVENQHIEREVINEFRSIMDPFYHKLSNYLMFVIYKLGKLMKLSHTIFGKLPKWRNKRRSVFR